MTNHKGVHTASRYHDFSAGHRVVGHENKCRHLHGHNYRVHFHCIASQLDFVGRVIDFSDIKSRLCMWLENNWDHKMLLWNEDPMRSLLVEPSTLDADSEEVTLCSESIVLLPFNPTAENMAEYLVEVVGPQQLRNTSITLLECVVEETRKCSASYTK